MTNVTHAAIQGIRVTVKTPNVSGVILQQCSHLHIQSITSIQEQGNDNNTVKLVSECVCGILAYESSDVEIDSLEVSNFTHGVLLYKAKNTSMMNVSAAHNMFDGMYLKYSTNTIMMNVSAVYNGVDGIHLEDSTNTSMMNVSAAHHEDFGIGLIDSTDTSIMNVYAAHNEADGIILIGCTNTSMMNVSAAHNGDAGIYLETCTNTNMINVSAAYTEESGIGLNYCTDTSMINVSTAHNKDIGIYLDGSTDTRVMNVSAAHNGISGINLFDSTDTCMMNVSVVHNQYNAITMSNCTNTSLYYSYTYHNGDGIYITGCTTTHILYHNIGNTMYIITGTDTHILNSLFNEHSEIVMRNTANTYIANTTSRITAYNTTNIVLNDTLFSNMDAPSTPSSTSEPTSLPAVVSLYSSTLNITDCKFTRNNISSIKTIGSNVTMSGKVLFHNNTAFLGTIFISAKNSLLITTDYSNIDFQNNHATSYGGVFYITTDELYETSMSLLDIQRNRYFTTTNSQGGGSLTISRTECFVRVEGSRSHARLTFINNTAGKGGDVLYGGLVALGYDGDWNCLLSFKNISDMSEQSGLSLI